MRTFVLMALLASCSGMSGKPDGGAAGGPAGGSAAAGGGVSGGGLAGGGLAGGTAVCVPVNRAAVALDVVVDGGVFPSSGLQAGTALLIDSPTIVTRVTTDGGVQVIELAGPSGPFLVTLGAPNLPAAFVSPGEAIGLRLAVRAEPSFGSTETNVAMSLRRGPDVIGFAFSGRQLFALVAIPDLSPERIAITAGPVQCETRVLTGCARVLYPASVSFDGGPPVTISTGQTRAVGPFDVTIESFEGSSGGNCDLPGWTELAGVRVR